MTDDLVESVSRDIASEPALLRDCGLCVEENQETEFRYDNDLF